MYKAFSLIELLVVVSIIAILAAVAIPSYRAYAVKTKVALIINLMDSCAEQALTSYQRTGSWPLSITCAGVTMANNNPWSLTHSLNNYGIYQMYWQNASSAGNMSVSVITTGLSAIGSSYVDGALCPGGGASCNNLIRTAYRDAGNAIIKKCGLDVPPGSGAYSIPLSFQPANCNCTNINNYINTGSSTC